MVAERQAGAAVSSSWWARAVAALLALEITWVHIIDQGGLLELRDPPYVGWGYRALEVAGVVVAVWILTGRRRRWAWLLAAAVAAGPLLGYVLSRGPGLPDYSDDIGNWFEPLGVMAVIAELLLVGLAAYALGVFERIRPRERERIR